MAKAKQRTLQQVEAEIERLKAEAAALKAAEIQGVIERIQAAIEHYGLTAKDLGFGRGDAKTPGASKDRKAGSGASTKSARQAMQPVAPKKPSVIKFRDESGHQWTGNGKRPKWFLDALASGKTADDLRVPAPSTSAAL